MARPPQNGRLGSGLEENERVVVERHVQHLVQPARAEPNAPQAQDEGTTGVELDAGRAADRLEVLAAIAVRWPELGARVVVGEPVFRERVARVYAQNAVGSEPEASLELG